MNKMNMIKKILQFLAYLFLAAVLLLLSPSISQAKLDVTSHDGTTIKRSLESLRDIDFQTWQVVAYPQKQDGNILRIVGYPGRLRLDHPIDLVVRSGIKEWIL